MIYNINFKEKTVFTQKESFNFEFESFEEFDFVIYDDLEKRYQYFLDNNIIKISEDFNEKIDAIVGRMHEIFDSTSLERAKSRKCLELNLESEFENYANSQSIITSSLGFNFYGDKRTRDILKTNPERFKSTYGISFDLSEDDIYTLIYEIDENFEYLNSQKDAYIAQITKAETTEEIEGISFSFENLDFSYLSQEDKELRLKLIEEIKQKDTIQKLKAALVTAFLENNQEKIKNLQAMYQKILLGE